MSLPRPLSPIPTAYAETNTNNENTYNYLNSLCDEIEDSIGDVDDTIDDRIDAATDGSYASIDALALEVKESAETCETLSEQTQYTTQATQVGAWYDDTPIWRKAFKVKFSDMTEVDYGAMVNDGVYGVPVPSPESLILSAMCVYMQTVDAFDASSDNYLDRVSGVDFTLPDDLPAYAELADEGVCGYVEYVYQPSENSET